MSTTAPAPLLEVEHLKLHFPIKKGILIDRVVGAVHAVDDISFELREGETLGLVGESGCGKTTLSRTVMRLLEPTSGAVRFRGRDVTHAGRKELMPLRREVQMVFQDPYASLNPRKRIGQIVGMALHHAGTKEQDVERRVRELLERVGLTYLFVAHDLSVVRHVSDRIAVMYLGKLMEVSPAEELYAKPIHPYAAALLEAIPIPDPRENRKRRRSVVSGEPPNPINPPSGCVFHPRCPRATDVCRTVEPPLTAYANGHLAACHHPLNVTAAEVAAATISPASPLTAGDVTPKLAA